MTTTGHVESEEPMPSRGAKIVTYTLWACLVAVLGTAIWYGISGRTTPAVTSLPLTGPTYPVGVDAPSELSGKAPPGPDALPGYRLSYETDFAGDRVPPTWYVFTGVSGDRGGQFAASHVSVRGGVLRLVTSVDPQFHGQVVTGGICQCGLAQTYGAYFVRSRFVGAGPNDSELLWPKRGWPPEIDFNENGGSMSGTSSTVHFGSTNRMQQNFVNVDMRKWHTWGVIWTRAAVTFVVDGHVWARVTAPDEIPRQPMTLDFQQHSLCASGQECPHAAAYVLIDWVAEYAPRGH